MLDATNSTEDRRNFLRTRFHGKWQYLFIESICNDMEVRGRRVLCALRSDRQAQGAGVRVDCCLPLCAGRWICGAAVVPDKCRVQGRKG